MVTEIKNLSQLKLHQIRFVVKQFAAFEEPECVQQQMREVYDLEMPIDVLLTMNPGVPDLCILDTDWTRHFFKVRTQIMNLVKKFPIASKSIRFGILQKLCDDFYAQGNIPMMIKVLDMARLESDPNYQELVRLMKMDTSFPIPSKPYEA